MRAGRNRKDGPREPGGRISRSGRRAEIVSVAMSQPHNYGLPPVRVETSGVYVIAPVGAQSPVKVGIAKEPMDRLRTLQVSHWCELEICRYWECLDFYAARRLERATHMALKANEIRGEWFGVGQEAAALAVLDTARALKIDVREISTVRLKLLAG